MLCIKDVQECLVRTSFDAVFELLCIVNVKFSNNQPVMRAKRLFVSSLNTNVLDFKATIHLTIHQPREGRFAIDPLLQSIGDQIVLFSTNVTVRREFPPTPKLRFLALATMEDFVHASTCLRSSDKVPIESIALMHSPSALDFRTDKLLRGQFCQNVWLPPPYCENILLAFFISHLDMTSVLFRQYHYEQHGGNSNIPV